MSFFSSTASNIFLQDQSYVSLSSLSSSLSSTVTSSATSLTDGRLKISNLLNQDIIFPIDVKNLREHIYFGSAYLKTKSIIYDIVANYPIGLSGGTTSSLYLEDIENANNYIATLSDYGWWCMRQLCGATLTSDTMSFTAVATAIPIALSASISSSSAYFTLPVIIRDAYNYLIPPQGVGTSVDLDNYFNNLLDQDPQDYLNGPSLTPYENILTTAIMFDYGMQSVLHQDWSGTGSHKFVFQTYDGVFDTEIIPQVFNESINRGLNFNQTVPAIMKQNDDKDILDRLLAAMGDMFDETKVYMDGFKQLYKNYWGNWKNLPQGYIQQLIAHQYGIELFSSDNSSGIQDNLNLRGSYKSPKEINFEFWNRILCSLIYILKTKGTIEAIRASGRAYGFTPGLLEIYELASYKTQINAYYNDVRNYTSGVFTKLQDINKRLTFKSVSADISGSYSALMVHVRTKFNNEPNLLNYNSISSASGILWSLAPNMQLSYQYTIDNKNLSTSGYPYISFTLSAGNKSLTTDYNFISSALNECETGIWQLFFGLDQTTLYGAVGYLPSNYDFFEPVITSISSSQPSLSSGLGYTSITLGDVGSPPNANLNNFYVQLENQSLEHWRDLVLDSTFVTASGGYQNNILCWKMNENVSLQTPGQNFILDAGPSGITGSPILQGSLRVPYEYEYDQPAFFNDEIPGFKMPFLPPNSSISAITNIIREKGIRVGVSLASPMNDFVHTIFGSRFGELYADPSQFFGTTGDGSLYHTYPVVNTKVDEFFAAIGSNRNQVQITEYLKFLNRIEGHLGSFFQFIDQIIPASKRLIEKGIIVEQPLFERSVVQKTYTRASAQNNAIFSFSGIPTVILANGNPPSSFIISSPTSTLGITTQMVGSINEVPTLGLEYTKFNLSNGAFAGSVDLSNDVTETLSVIKTQSGSVTASPTGCLDFGGNYSGTYNLPSIYSNFAGPIQFQEYIPRNCINENTITYFSSDEQVQLNSNYLNSIVPNNIGISSYFMNITLSTENSLLRTSLTASQSEKTLSGSISIIDATGRQVATNYESIQIDLSLCQFNGLNRVRFTLNGQDIPYNQQMMRFPISSPQGVNFIINITNAPGDGIENQASNGVILVDNLLSSQTGTAILLKFADNVEIYNTLIGQSTTKPI